MGKLNTSGLLLMGVLLLSACGGGGHDVDPRPRQTTQSSNNPEPAGLSEDEQAAEQTAKSGIETAKSYLASQQQQLFALKGRTGFDGGIVTLAGLEGLGQVMKADEEITEGECGGRLITNITTTNPSDPEQSFPLTVEVSGQFEEYCLGDAEAYVRVSGPLESVVHYDSMDNGYRSVDYQLDYVSNIPFSAYNGFLNYSEYCTIVNGVDDCARTVRHQADDEGTYTLGVVELSGSASSGYNFSGTLQDNLGQEYEITATGVTLCENGNLQSGEISITDANGESIVITVANCNEVTVQYQNNSWLLSQTA